MITIPAKPKPEYQVKTRLCPHCDKYCHLAWLPERKHISVAENKTLFLEKHFSASQCDNCGGICLWLGAVQIYPDKASVEPPNKDLPPDIKKLYDEAASILNKSPRASAALLRVALERLCKEKGNKNSSLDKNIKLLREQKMIPETLVQAMTAIRLVGNDAAHSDPSKIDFDVDDDESSAVAEKLFRMINIIADRLITNEKDVKDLMDDLNKEAQPQTPAEGGET